MHFTKMGTRMTEEQRSAKGNAEREWQVFLTVSEKKNYPSLETFDWWGW